MIKANSAGNLIPKNKRKKADVSRTMFILSIITYPLLLFIVFYVYVNLNSIAMAFTRSNIYGKTWFVGLENFKLSECCQPPDQHVPDVFKLVRAGGEGDKPVSQPDLHI